MKNVISLETARLQRERANQVFVAASVERPGWVAVFNLDSAVKVILEWAGPYGTEQGGSLQMYPVAELPEGMDIDNLYPTLGDMADDVFGEEFFRINLETAIETIHHLIDIWDFETSGDFEASSNDD